MKILLVDDSDVSLFIMENWLRKGGYEVRTAKNGMEALKVLEAEPVDLIISDAMMPIMDGFRLCHRVKSMAHIRHIPFVFCSADYISLQDQQFARSLGASRYIVKSEDPVTFIRELEQVLEQSEQEKVTTETAPPPEEEYLREYSRRLIRKLEEKVASLEQTNDQLLESNRRLQELDRLKDDFLSVLSHELRTPLTAVIGFSELLLDGVAGLLNPEQEQYLKIAFRRAEDLEHLIEELLEFTRIRAGKRSAAFRPVRLGELIKTATDTVHILKQQKQMGLTVSLPDPNTLVHVDPDALRRVLIILLDNAIKFTPVGGTITLEATADADRLTFRVSDTGIGIPADYLPVIFDSFRQLEGHEHRCYGGLGLGLAIARNLVEMHDGRIEVASQEGQGSTFTVVLPRRGAGRQEVPLPLAEEKAWAA